MRTKWAILKDLMDILVLICLAIALAAVLLVSSLYIISTNTRGRYANQNPHPH